MTAATEITEAWGDGTYTFRLGIQQLEEHDEKFGKGPLAILGSFVDGTFRHGYIRETIRLGLIGGGTSPVQAMKLVERYVDGRPIIENLPFAIAILGAAIHGKVEGKAEDGGNGEAARSKSDPSGSTSPPSDETPAP